jgi:hypothetical protein
MSDIVQRHVRAGRREARRRVRALWVAGIGAGIAGTAALLIAATGVASGSQSPIPQGKLARIEALQAQLAKENSGHNAKPSYTARLKAAEAASQAVQERHAGITAMRQGPFAASSFDVQNFYQGPAAGTWLLVYAGATTNPVTGAIAGGALNVYAEPQIGGAMSFVGVFLAPGGNGALTVVAASGDRLTLRASGGNQLTFNLATHAYAS